MWYVLWLDDYRPVSPEWLAQLGANVADVVIAKNYDEFRAVINGFGCPWAISFDHDLADAPYADDFSTEKTGMDCAKWLGEQVLDSILKLPDNFVFRVHSMNPDGAENIRRYMHNLVSHVRRAK